MKALTGCCGPGVVIEIDERDPVNTRLIAFGELWFR